MGATSSQPGSSSTSDDRRVVLITGVTGMVGRALAAHLTEAGWSVRGLSRNAESAARALPCLESTHAWNGADGAVPDAAIEGVDAVVHLAGEPVSGRWTAAKKRRIEQSRVGGTERLVAAFSRSEHPPSVLVSASAMGYYGDRGETSLEESAAPGDDFLAGVCVGWERTAAHAEAYGARVASIRISLVLGESGVLGAMRPLFLAGLGGPIGSGRQRWSWIHVDDLVSLLTLALTNDAIVGPLNAATDAPTQREFAQALGDALGRPAFIPTPKLAVRAAMSGFADELVNSRRLDPTLALSHGWKPRFDTLAEALRDALP